MRIIIKNNLEPLATRFKTLESFQKALLTGGGWRETAAIKNLECVGSNLKEGAIYHRDFLHTLEIAYAQHYGIAITPDAIWFTLLTQLAGMVKTSPEKFKVLFTRSNDIQHISVPASSFTVLPIDLVVNQLKEKSPLSPNHFFQSSRRQRHKQH